MSVRCRASSVSVVPLVPRGPLPLEDHLPSVFAVSVITTKPIFATERAEPAFVFTTQLDVSVKLVWMASSATLESDDPVRCFAVHFTSVLHQCLSRM